MEYRTLGRTGLRVSAVALGCEGFMHKTAEEVKADMDYAISNGIYFIDSYAPNPELRANIGAALAGRRDGFVIQGHLCTVWEEGQYLRTRDPRKTLASFELQLRQLRTDYLDIGMIHYVDAESDFREVFDGEIVRIAERLRAEGRIRHIGLSSHNPKVALLAARTGIVDVVMFSVNPCYDLQPAGEQVEALWAEQSYAEALHNVDPDRERGVKDLYRLLTTEPSSLAGAFVADKVVGKAAAALLILGGVGELHADVISRPALDLLQKAGVAVGCTLEVPRIINRTRTGWCPLETRCDGLTTPGECLAEIERFLNETSAGK